MVVCTGSIAYDYILNFKGRFKEHILPDKTHILNLSFLVDELLPHDRREDAAVYPEVARLLGGSDPTAAMSRAHLEIEHLVGSFQRLRLIDGEHSRLHHDRSRRQPDHRLLRGAMRQAATLGLDDASRNDPWSSARTTPRR